MAHPFFIEAVRDLKTVVKCAPHDADAKAKLAECEKDYKRHLFEEAIAVGEKVSVVVQFGDLETINVESRFLSITF